MFKGEKYKAESMKTPLDADLISVSAERMTVNGAVNKTLTLTGLMFITTLFSYYFFNPIFLYVGIFGAMGLGFWASRAPHKSPMIAPIYALVEGLFVGAISFQFASIAGTTGIIFQAACITISLLFTMLMIYKAGWIQVTEKFRAGVAMAVGAVMITYVIQFVLTHFFGTAIPFLHQAGAMGIGITVAILVIACMKLLVDFDNFYKGEQANAPKYMEWYSGMGLIATIVWIYYEALHLILMLSGE